MNYKVGDKVIVKSWNEMVEEFGLCDHNSINLSHTYCWPKYLEKYLPSDRIITITKVNNKEAYYKESVDGYKDEDSVFKEMIKCSANEYYLQEIKEELCQN